jgi:hypothetical protein
MSKQITPLNPSQGITANLITSFLVLGASSMELPLSTTPVSVGALLGLGVATRQARWKVIATVLAAWVITLPWPPRWAGRSCKPVFSSDRARGQSRIDRMPAARAVYRVGCQQFRSV